MRMSGWGKKVKQGTALLLAGLMMVSAVDVSGLEVNAAEKKEYEITVFGELDEDISYQQLSVDDAAVAGTVGENGGNEESGGNQENGAVNENDTFTPEDSQTLDNGEDENGDVNAGAGAESSGENIGVENGEENENENDADSQAGDEAENGITLFSTGDPVEYKCNHTAKEYEDSSVPGHETTYHLLTCLDCGYKAADGNEIRCFKPDESNAAAGHTTTCDCGHELTDSTHTVVV